MSRRRVKARPPTEVRVSWDSGSEKVAATTDHAMMVLLDGSADSTSDRSSHRVYWTGSALRQAQMCAVVVDFIKRMGLGKLVLRILAQNPEPGETRGTDAVSFCPHCGHMEPEE